MDGEWMAPDMDRLETVRSCTGSKNAHCPRGDTDEKKIMLFGDDTRR